MSGRCALMVELYIFILRASAKGRIWFKIEAGEFLTAGILNIFRGFKNESNKEIGPKGAFCRGLAL